MAIETIQFGGETYPALQGRGFAAKFAFNFAFEFGIGINGTRGYDIGCSKREWKLPYSIPVDSEFAIKDAFDLPDITVDYIFSSHCLEHLKDWVGALDYWATKIKSGGILFLYLPHPDQKYWRPWNNRKHVNILYPENLEQYLLDRQCWKNIFVTKGWDLNHSFYVVAEKI